MAVKNTTTEEVHYGTKGGETGCGFDTSGSNWITSYTSITCEKKGCKD
ncbi:hypothetical protein [Kordia sp.]